jgi:hypothetical protein
MSERGLGSPQPDTTASELEIRLREWLAEEERQAAEARSAAESYRGVDTEAMVDMNLSAHRHEATVWRIQKVLYEAGVL